MSNCRVYCKTWQQRSSEYFSFLGDNVRFCCEGEWHNISTECCHFVVADVVEKNCRHQHYMTFEYTLKRHISLQKVSLLGKEKKSHRFCDIKQSSRLSTETRAPWDKLSLLAPPTWRLGAAVKWLIRCSFPVTPDGTRYIPNPPAWFSANLHLQNWFAPVRLIRG